MGMLAAQNWFSYQRKGGQDDHLRKLTRNVNNAAVDIRTYLARTSMKMSDLLSLQVGDIITTDKPCTRRCISADRRKAKIRRQARPIPWPPRRPNHRDQCRVRPSRQRTINRAASFEPRRICRPTHQSPGRSSKNHASPRFRGGEMTAIGPGPNRRSRVWRFSCRLWCCTSGERGYYGTIPRSLHSACCRSFARC